MELKTRNNDSALSMAKGSSSFSPGPLRCRRGPADEPRRSKRSLRTTTKPTAQNPRAFKSATVRSIASDILKSGW